MICRISIFLFIFSLGLNTFSQKEFLIQDAFSKENLSFTKVLPSQEKPVIADINGRFMLSVFPQQVLLRANGYRDTTFNLTEDSNNVLQLFPVQQQLQEVTILPGVNPAHRIILQTINNRKKNHPMENDGFIASQYSKFVFDIDADSKIYLNDSSRKNYNDSVTQRIRNFFNKQYLFLIETSSKQFFDPPYRQKEVIDAYKVSGFSDPLFATFAKEMQSFHFYDNQVSLLGKEYVNPIAFGGINRYLFILEDTTINQSDTTYTIFYRPKKGKNFDGLTGRLYINTNNFAIEKVTARPYFISDSSEFTIAVTQEYAFRNNQKWFPLRLSTTIDFNQGKVDLEKGLLEVSTGSSSTPVKQGFIQGKGYTEITAIEFNPKELAKEKFNNQATSTLPDAGEKTNTTLEQRRPEELTQREENTYVEIGRIVEENKLDKALAIGKILASGKIPMGQFQWDLNRFLDYNSYEGFRLGAGLETSEKLVKWLTIGGYFGYGFRDKTFKYGAYTEWRMNIPTQTKLKLFWQNDVVETAGFESIREVNLLAGEQARRLFVNNMAMVEQFGAQFKTTLRSNMHFTLRANRQSITYNNDYMFQGQNNFEAFTTSLIWNWNIREKVNLLGQTVVPLGTKFPKVQVQYDRGWDKFPGSNLNLVSYNRVQLQIQQQLSLLTLGKLQWMVRGVWSDGNQPLFFQTNVPATFANWSISVPNTFETVGASEFYHQQALSAFLRWFSPAKKTLAKWNEPKIGLHYAFGIGSHNDKGDHSLTFRSMDKGFHEAGLLTDGLFVSGNATIGLGGFYRFGYYANSDWKKNLVPKIVIGFKF